MARNAGKKPRDIPTSAEQRGSAGTHSAGEQRAKFVSAGVIDCDEALAKEFQCQVSTSLSLAPLSGLAARDSSDRPPEFRLSKGPVMTLYVEMV